MQPKNFRIIKTEIRVLGVDDGRFIPHTQGSAIVVGVVFRGGCIIDGVMHTHVSIDGFDATEKLVSMITSSPHHKQLRLIMLNGITLAGFNVVNLNKLSLLTKLPIIALTLEKPDLQAVHNAIDSMPNSEERWKTIQEAGEIHQIRCKGKALYAELVGISLFDAQEIIKLTSTNSSFPEPLRVAHLIASGVSL